MTKSMLSVTDSIGGRTFTLHLTTTDLASVKLTQFDHALLNDIDNGPPSNTPIADKLLGVEMIVRRIEEQRDND